MTVRRRIRCLLAVAMVVTGFAVLAGCGGGGDGKKVPKVEGKSLVQAAKTLSEAQYLVDISIVRGKPPRHTVLKQDPEGGSEAKAGTKVKLEVSDGVERK